MPSTGKEKLLYGLIIYLTVLSLTCTYFIQERYGEEISGIDLGQNINFISANSTQDFKTNQVNISFLIVDSISIWDYRAGVGRLLMQKGRAPNTYLLIENILPVNNKYINSYKINNSVKGDYTIVLRYTGGLDQNEIKVSQRGFHIPNYILPNQPFGDKYFFPYNNANQITDVNIQTVYDDTIPSVDFIFNGQKIFTTSGRNTLSSNDNMLNLFNRYYGGCASETLGFAFEVFNTQGSITDTSNWNDTIGELVSFVVLLAKITLWFIDVKYMPIAFNIIFIKTADIAIFAIIFSYLRGN